MQIPFCELEFHRSCGPWDASSGAGSCWTPIGQSVGGFVVIEDLHAWSHLADVAVRLGDVHTA
jgi:hypothetical protein